MCALQVGGNKQCAWRKFDRQVKLVNFPRCKLLPINIKRGQHRDAVAFIEATTSHCQPKMQLQNHTLVVQYHPLFRKTYEKRGEREREREAAL